MTDYQTLLMIGEWFGLVSAVAAIGYCVTVALDFHRSAWLSLSQGCHSSYDWLICGVYVSFTSKVLDGTFWMITWSANYLSLPIHETLMAAGPLVNVGFRNVMWLLAGYCHTRGLAEAAGGGSRINTVSRRFSVCCLIGIVYGLSVELARWVGACQ